MGLYAWFADVLEYPDAGFVERLEGWPASQALGDVDGCVRESIARFLANAERDGLARLQEAYIAAFDMDPACALYVGHHLFGEDVRRSLFMARLSAEYRAWAPNAAGQDLPDRLPVLLRYVDGPVAEAIRTELIEEALLPAVRCLTQALADRDHPYAPLLRGLLQALDALQAGT